MQITPSYSITALLLTVSTVFFGCERAGGDESSGTVDNAFPASDGTSDQGDAGPAVDEQRPPEPGGACSSDDDCAPAETGMRCSYLDCGKSAGSCADATCEPGASSQPVCGCDGRKYQNACDAAARGVVVAPNDSCLGQAQRPPTPVQQLPPSEPPPPAEPPPTEAELICTAVSAAKVAGLGGGVLVEMVLDVIDDAPLVGGILAGTARTALGALGLFDAPMCQVAITLRDFNGLPSVSDAVTTLRLPPTLFNLVGVNPDALTIATVANCCETW